MITSIELTNFRRFKKIKLYLSKNVLIIGSNSLGKTSILEALSIASSTKSHQTTNLNDVIYHENEYTNIKILDDEKNEYKVIISKKGKSCFFNKNEIKLISNYLGKLPLIFFSPYNLNLIKGAPQLRRNFLNLQISQFDNIYLKNLNIYNNLLKERNLLLKNDQVDLNLLEVITVQMTEYAKKIMDTREQFITDINKYITQVNTKLKEKEIIKVCYLPNLNKNDILADFHNHLQLDIKNRQTEVGIQRDDIFFLINEKDASKFASLGQIRSVILSLQITLCILYKKKFGKYPLLLLDDVFGELDKDRINNLLQIINNLDQVIISSVDLANIDQKLIKNYQIIDLGADFNE